MTPAVAFDSNAKKRMPSLNGTDGRLQGIVANLAPHAGVHHDIAAALFVDEPEELLQRTESAPDWRLNSRDPVLHVLTSPGG